jgi:hypothetical protein
MYKSRPCCNSVNVAVAVTSALVGVYNEAAAFFLVQLPDKRNTKMKRTPTILFFRVFIN